MHELGIASSVLEAVKAETDRNPGTRACRIGLRIGELAAIDQESLRFCFEAITHETEFENLQLEIELCPRRHRCEACSHEFRIDDYNFRCPQCASLDTKCISGDELELAFLEVEEYGTCPVGTESIK